MLLYVCQPVCAFQLSTSYIFLCTSLSLLYYFSFCSQSINFKTETRKEIVTVLSGQPKNKKQMHTSSSCPFRPRFFCFSSCLSRSGPDNNCKSVFALAIRSALASEPIPFLFRDNLSTFGWSSSCLASDLLKSNYDH